ncbi:MAG: hypothetical protein E7244_27145 [Enterocloster citroniae]|nr:hypothetical protein [Enterocloster citroniae]
MERLRIEYETGYMELNVEAFFPCKMPAMRKAARLINSYCSDETRAALLSELREMADGYTALCGMYKEIEEALPADTPERRHWRAQFNKTEVLRKRMEGNIRLISGGGKG